jgi:ribosome-associated protein
LIHPNTRRAETRSEEPEVVELGARPEHPISDIPPRERPSRMTERTSIERSREIASWCALAGLEKKAARVEIIEVAGRTDYADCLVLMTGASDRHVAAIARGVDQELSRQGVRCWAMEGLPLGNWVLIDFVDVVVHVFHQHWRDVYDLDGLWMDAPRLPLPEVSAERLQAAALESGVDSFGESYAYDSDFGDFSTRG